MASSKKIRLALLATTALVLVVSLTIAPVLADGALLRGFDVPVTTPFNPGPRVVNPSIYWPIGIAFDGRNLWYSQPCICTSDIFLSSTTGTLLNTLKEVKEAGALAWDGNHLWVARAAEKTITCTAESAGCATITEVDVTTGNPINVVDISSIFAPDQECNFIDGLSWDTATGSLWVSPDIGCAFAFTSNACSIGFVYNVDTSGNLVKRIQEPFGVAGVAKVGSNLYMVRADASTCHRDIAETTLDGTVVSSFAIVSVSGHHENAESIGFDPITFAPSCALWAVQDYGFPFDASLAAYQIACPA